MNIIYTYEHNINIILMNTTKAYVIRYNSMIRKKTEMKYNK